MKVFDWLMKLCKSIDANKTMQADDIMEAVDLILTDYYFLKDTELAYIARMIKLGKYGDFGYRFKIPELFSAIRTYDETERARFLNYGRDENINRTQYEDESSRVSLKSKKLNEIERSKHILARSKHKNENK